MHFQKPPLLFESTFLTLESLKSALDHENIEKLSPLERQVNAKERAEKKVSKNFRLVKRTSTVNQRLESGSVPRNYGDTKTLPSTRPQSWSNTASRDALRLPVRRRRRRKFSTFSKILSTP